jgi:predicted N-acetyltransferase YhbS
MMHPMLSIRSPETEHETVATHNLLAEVFGTLPMAHEQASQAAAWRARREAWSKLTPSTVRSAFRNDTCLGTYQLDKRELRLGSALIPVGCIGAVATSPEYRNQGVASALMRDAEALAQQQGLGLLLLHGIGNFYQRFGYTNVADLIRQHIALQHINTLPPSDCSVRQATTDDAEALRQLYNRHQGCFQRSSALQHELLRRSIADRPPVLALDRSGEPCGYLLPPSQSNAKHVREVGADTWDAAVALLQHHAAILRSADNQASTLVWSLGLQSWTYYLLADHIPLECVIESIPNAEWMGRTASLPALFAALLPAWQARASDHPAALRWVIDDETVQVCRDQGQLRCAEVANNAPIVQLTQTTFTSLLFGYRPVAWALRQPGQAIPPLLIPLIEQLFGPNRLFVPKSDEF